MFFVIITKNKKKKNLVACKPKNIECEELVLIGQVLFFILFLFFGD